jgi:hypothetical protein
VTRSCTIWAGTQYLTFMRPTRYQLRQRGSSRLVETGKIYEISMCTNIWVCAKKGAVGTSLDADDHLTSAPFASISGCPYLAAYLYARCGSVAGKHVWLLWRPAEVSGGVVVGVVV